MMKLQNMLIIGGASRNVGKTELVCSLIKKFSRGREIITLKISGINPGNKPGQDYDKSQIEDTGAGNETISGQNSGKNKGSAKIAGHSEEENPVHGHHGTPPKKYHLLEETNQDGVKDSSKMLVAGAKRAFYLRTKDEYLAEAMDHFFTIIDRRSLIICESITLRKIIEPGLFIIIKSDKVESVKKSLGEVLHLVDLTIVSDGHSFRPGPHIISLNNHGWQAEHG